MTGCPIRVPLSLADAQTIIAACTGPDWHGRFLLGLETVLFLGLLAFVVWMGVRAAWRP